MESCEFYRPVDGEKLRKGLMLTMAVLPPIAQYHDNGRCLQKSQNSGMGERAPRTSSVALLASRPRLRCGGQMNRAMKNAKPFHRDSISIILTLRDLTPAVDPASSSQLSRSKRDSIFYCSVVLFIKLACSSQKRPVQVYIPPNLLRS